MHSRSLLKQVHAGDTNALGLLYDRHAACLFGVAKRILRAQPNPDLDAEEALLEAFTALWRTAASLEDEPAFCWLVHATRQAALARRTVLPSPVLPTAPTVENGSYAYADGLRQLPWLQRTAIELAFFDGLSISGLSQVLDASQSAIREAMASGMRSLRNTAAMPQPDAHTRDEPHFMPEPVTAWATPPPPGIV